MAKQKVILSVEKYEKIEQRARLYSEENDCWLKIFKLCISFGMKKRDDQSNLEGVLEYIESLKKDAGEAFLLHSGVTQIVGKEWLKKLQEELAEERITNHHADFCAEYRRRVDAESRIKELETEYAQLKECNLEWMEKYAQYCIEAQERMSDAELGRLVRLMPDRYELSHGVSVLDDRHHWYVVDRSTDREGVNVSECDTPEEALIAAGVGETNAKC